MIELGCGDCGSALAAVASTHRTAPAAGTAPSPSHPYPSLFLTCPQCGSAWEQDTDGGLTKRRTRDDASEAGTP